MGVTNVATVCNVTTSGNFTILSNYRFRSANLSNKAQGLLSKVCSLPEGWDYTIAGLVAICKESETAITNALDELKEWGYLFVKKLMPSQTKRGRIEYVFNFYEYSKKDTPFIDAEFDELKDAEPLGMAKGKTERSCVFRVHKTSSYTVFSNHIFRNTEIKLGAIGLMCRIATLPSDWKFTISGLCKICKEKKSAIRAALKELEKHGYMKRTKLMPNQTASGRIEYEYDFYEIPENVETVEKKSSAKQISKKQGIENLPLEIQPLENQGAEKQVTENQGQLIKQDKSRKNKSRKNKKSINQSTGKTPVENVDGWTDSYASRHKHFSQLIKWNIGYDKFVFDIMDDDSGYMTVEELDEIVSMIATQICSSNKTQRICGQEFPRNVVHSVMMKVDRDCIERTVEAMKHTCNVRNYQNYFISTLYNETVTKNARERAEDRAVDYAIQRDFGGTHLFANSSMQNYGGSYGQNNFV